ncbi:MAG TPA: ferric reductase-like transmembrane domain-containing protein [Ktedonobacterales bacterium]|jgi:hypothetical protein|nr:ferric reductase-like transmembrane domain-containing protein [Ktedonobacterales bacterium]
MSVWGQVTWDIARAGGFVAYGLLTLAVALGLALSMRWQAPRWPRLINSELHNFVTLLSLVFTIIHVLAVWLDPFTAFGWSEIFIPFASHYRAIWMAFGIVALYLGLALAASVWLRPFIGYEWWRRLHVLTLVVYALVTVHGLTTGSDTRTVWGAAIYGLSGLAIVAMVWIRLLAPTGPLQRRHPIWVGITALALFVGVIATMLGPMRSGWNAFANGSGGSGQRGAAPSTVAGQSIINPSSTGTPNTSVSDTGLVAPFLAQVTGSFSQAGPDANGSTQLTLQSSLHDTQSGKSGALTIIITGVDQGDGSIAVTGSQVNLGPSTTNTTYRGQLSQLSSDDDHWRMEGTLNPTSGSGSSIDLLVTLRMQSGGQVSGQAQAVSGASGSSNSSSSNSSSGTSN